MQLFTVKDYCILEERPTCPCTLTSPMVATSVLKKPSKDPVP